MPPYGVKRKDHRIIVHFDYDCFYASVFEAANPVLKTQPLAVQQKQIIVTCNYEARRRGLRKLQLVRDARRVCPDAVIVLGEDLTRFRDASKALYAFIRRYSWNQKVERLGFDEVFMDVTDLVEYNRGLLNRNDLRHSFFQLSTSDPTQGFAFDATTVSGHTFPAATQGPPSDSGELHLRLLLGSHLGRYIRHQLEEHTGYTSTVGISTSKLLSKLVGNVHKPKGQTTLLPPYEVNSGSRSNVTAFLDGHDVGAVPWIGFKLAQQLRELVLGRPADTDLGLVTGIVRDGVTVQQVREVPGLSPEVLGRKLAGPGAPQGIGLKVFNLLHGMDDTEVGHARDIPRQISIEDSYMKLDSMDQVVAEMTALTTRLIQRMHVDLLADDHDTGGDDAADNEHSDNAPKRWLAHPSTLRLTTRPRLPPGPDGRHPRTFKRISRSAPLPSSMLALHEPASVLAQGIVTHTLIPLFQRLHPEKEGWNLSLVNVAVSDMVETGGSGRAATGRDIGVMFRRQEEVLEPWRVRDEGADADADADAAIDVDVDADEATDVDVDADEAVDVDVGADEATDVDVDWESAYRCATCGEHIPSFAQAAHERFHTLAERDTLPSSS